jgi:hypothetical protein
MADDRTSRPQLRSPAQTHFRQEGDMLLDRDTFRAQVFARDSHKCIICGRGAADGVRIDAHHIIERRLWPDGGYYLDNGATLCDEGEKGCHYKAETTDLSVEDIRIAAGIRKVCIPPDMYHDHVYDKWGNITLEDGRRTRGPLFHDASVQKVIAAHLGQFTDYVKYPRTHHLPWSPGITEDDRVLRDLSGFLGKRVIVTRKMDGENFSGYTGYSHARSVDGRHHYTRDWAKTFWMQRAHDLPQGWRLCAENLYAVHSIPYADLPGYLLAFSIWDERNACLSWDESLEWFDLLDIPRVPVLFDGIWDEAAIRALYDERHDWDAHEGYVVRLADSFAYGDFKASVAKFVRARHVATTKHWMYGAGRRHDTNGLAAAPQEG